MLHTIVEDNLSHIKDSDRFKLVNEVVLLAKSAPPDIKEKPVIWALKTLLEKRSSTPSSNTEPS